jgi:HPt (histidine-containing phosphotransfer) domain-containing protein
LAAASDTSPSAPSEIPAEKLTAERNTFQERLRTDKTELARLRARRQSDPTSTAALEELQAFAHKLAGAACFFGFDEVGRVASALEESIVQRNSGRGLGDVEANVDALMDCLGNGRSQPNTEVASLATQR